MLFLFIEYDEHSKHKGIEILKNSIKKGDKVTDIKAKPNAKDKYIVEIKTNIINWLNTYSEKYKIRKKRKETAVSYYRCIIMYITLVIYSVAQKFN